jgi:Protein of unknown function (DUF4232)
MIPAQHAAPALVRACRADQIGVRLGAADAAAGTTYFAIVFTNRGTTSCSLRGYPGVSSVSAPAGRQIGAAALRSPGRLVTVVLRPGAAASAAYGQADALDYPRARCHPVTARGLRVYAPDQTRARYLATKHLACSSTAAGDSVIRPVVRGTTGVAPA